MLKLWKHIIKLVIIAVMIFYVMRVMLWGTIVRIMNGGISYEW
jgi:hypothetical protein